MSIKTIPQFETTRTPRERIPPLANGDHLSLWEFEQRYAAMPEKVIAELVEGVVYMSSPVTLDHGNPHALIITWLGVYSATCMQIEIADNTSVRLDLDNEVQPDALLRFKKQSGGQSGETKARFVQGAPELVVEVAVSSASFDLHEKMNVYRRNGVMEYIVWQVLSERLDWFRLREGKYERVEPDAQGMIRSEVFPGLWLAVDKLLNGDLAGVLAELQKGIATPEHAAFVAKLATQ
ncbi:MAG: Uma2 family endonuclease [Chloroflexi bacterium]|nr:Uma2 family endonuclease [Chloroflexota bacterium]